MVAAKLHSMSQVKREEGGGDKKTNGRNGIDWIGGTG